MVLAGLVWLLSTSGTPQRAEGAPPASREKSTAPVAGGKAPPPAGAIEEAIAWLTPQLGQPHVDQALIVSAVEKYAWAAPERAAAWLHAFNDARLARQQAPLGYPVLLSTWIARSGAPAVGEWLHTQAGHRHYDRLALNYAALLAPQDPAEAARWAGTIKNPALQADALARVKK